MARRLLATLVMAGVAAVALAAGAASPGTLEEKYESGAIKARYAIGADKQKNGAFQTFYESGKVMESGTYLKDQLDGVVTTLDENGRKLATAEWRAGKKSGIFREYQNGTLAVEQFWADDFLVYPRSDAIIHSKLAEIRRTKVTTVMPAAGEEPIPAHRGGNQPQPGREDALRSLMEYRYLSYVPWEGLSLDARYNACDEAAAALMVDMGKMDHHPANPGWPDSDFKMASEGCGHSNLYWSTGAMNLVQGVAGWMDDSDAGNIDRIGHRRWCLNPPMGKSGFAVVKGYAAMWALDTSREDVPDYDFVSYPGRGLFPSTHIAPSAAWHVSLNPDKYRTPDEKNVHVTVKPAQVVRSPAAVRTAAELKLNYFHIDTEIRGIPNAIIFRIDKASTQPGAAYLVEITGLEGKDGTPATVKYLVEFFR